MCLICLDFGQITVHDSYGGGSSLQQGSPSGPSLVNTASILSLQVVIYSVGDYLKLSCVPPKKKKKNIDNSFTDKRIAKEKTSILLAHQHNTEECL